MTDTAAEPAPSAPDTIAMNRSDLMTLLAASSLLVEWFNMLERAEHGFSVNLVDEMARHGLLAALEPEASTEAPAGEPDLVIHDSLSLALANGIRASDGQPPLTLQEFIDALMAEAKAAKAAADVTAAETPPEPAAAVA